MSTDTTRDERLSARSAEDLLTPPVQSLQALPGGTERQRLGRVLVVGVIVALLVAPWTAQFVYGPLWSVFTAGRGDGFELPFVQAVVLNLLFLVVIAGLSLGVRATLQADLRQMTTSDGLSEVLDCFQEQYRKAATEALPREGLPPVETCRQIRADAHAAAYEAVREKYFSGLARPWLLLVQAILFALVAGGVNGSVTVAAGLPSALVALLCAGWAGYFGWLQLGVRDSRDYAEAQLDPLPRDVGARGVGGLLILQAVLVVALSVVVLYVRPGGAPLYPSAAAAAQDYRAASVQFCRSVFLQARGEDFCEAEVPPVAVMVAAFEAPKEEGKLTAAQLRLRVTPEVLTRNFAPVYRIRVSQVVGTDTEVNAREYRVARLY